VCIGVLVSFFLFRQWREQANKLSARGKLKNIALAMNVYAGTHGTFPPQALCDRDGTPLLSWRVLLLPYIEEDALYRQFKLDEPWNSPNNMRLLPMIPGIYKLNFASGHDRNSTFFQVFVGGGAAFDGCGLVPRKDFRDGLARTILVIEAGQPVLWTKPEDLSYAAHRPLPKVGGVFTSEFNFATADATVVTLGKSESEEFVRQFVTRRGAEPLSDLEKRLFDDGS
jgi:hypothetical protein